MKTQTVTAAHQPIPVPLVGHVLSSPTSATPNPADPSDLDPETLTARATTISTLLKEMLEQRGHPHGGIND